jgi:hypothetical protein
MKSSDILPFPRNSREWTMQETKGFHHEIVKITMLAMRHDDVRRWLFAFNDE